MSVPRQHGGTQFESRRESLDDPELPSWRELGERGEGSRCTSELRGQGIRGDSQPACGVDQPDEPARSLDAESRRHAVLRESSRGHDRSAVCVRERHELGDRRVEVVGDHPDAASCDEHERRVEDVLARRPEVNVLCGTSVCGTGVRGTSVRGSDGRSQVGQQGDDRVSTAARTAGDIRDVDLDSPRDVPDELGCGIRYQPDLRLRRRESDFGVEHCAQDREIPGFVGDGCPGPGGGEQAEVGAGRRRAARHGARPAGLIRSQGRPSPPYLEGHHPEGGCRGAATRLVHALPSG